MGWAHALWQRHELDPFYFCSLDKRKQLWYIASEQVEREKPQGALNLLLKAISKLKGKGNKKRR